jgi:hypothetical protein
MFIIWNAYEISTGELIRGLTMYNCKIKIPAFNSKLVKAIIKNSIQVKTKVVPLKNNNDSNVIDENTNDNNIVLEHNNINHINEDNYLVSFNFKIQNFLEMLEAVAFEIFINDEDHEYDWVGLKRYKIADNIKQSEFLINFNMITDKRKKCDVNRFSITLFHKGIGEKPLTINNVPYPIILDIE